MIRQHLRLSQFPVVNLNFGVKDNWINIVNKTSFKTEFYQQRYEEII